MSQFDRINEKLKRMTPWQCMDALHFALGYGATSKKALNAIEAGIDFTKEQHERAAQQPTTVNLKPPTPNR